MRFAAVLTAGARCGQGFKPFADQYDALGGDEAAGRGGKLNKFRAELSSCSRWLGKPRLRAGRDCSFVVEDAQWHGGNGDGREQLVEPARTAGTGDDARVVAAQRAGFLHTAGVSKDVEFLAHIVDVVGNASAPDIDIDAELQPGT